MAVLLQRDMLQEILKFLAPRELAACGAVCSTWLDVSQSAPLWTPHCEALWQNKMYVPARQLAVTGSQTYAKAYVQSLRHAANEHITMKELCSFRWQFRFKLSAGAFFVEHDPYWNKEGPTMKRYFHQDGSLTSDPGDPFFSKHEDMWRFTKTKQGKPGQFIKVNHWPALEISRNPDDWSLTLQNEWVIYTAEQPLAGSN